MTNSERLAEALGVSLDSVPQEKQDQINNLSSEEVDKLIELSGKVAHKDDQYGPFPV